MEQPGSDQTGWGSGTDRATGGAKPKARKPWVSPAGRGLVHVEIESHRQLSGARVEARERITLALGGAG